MRNDGLFSPLLLLAGRWLEFASLYFSSFLKKCSSFTSLENFFTVFVEPIAVQLRLPRWICGMMVSSLLSWPVVGWSLARSISRVFEFLRLVFLLCENLSRVLSSRLRLSRWICGMMVSSLLLFSSLLAGRWLEFGSLYFSSF